VSRPFRARKTFTKEVRGQPEFQAGLRKQTRILESAIVFCAASFTDTGNYARKVRAVGNRVELRDIAWHMIEYGSANNRPFAPVRRAVRLSGMRFDGSPDEGQQYMPGIS
jgi:hypothetical protein